MYIDQIKHYFYVQQNKRFSKEQLVWKSSKVHLDIKEFALLYQTA